MYSFHECSTWKNRWRISGLSKYYHNSRNYWNHLSRNFLQHQVSEKTAGKIATTKSASVNMYTNKQCYFQTMFTTKTGYNKGLPVFSAISMFLVFFTLHSPKCKVSQQWLLMKNTCRRRSLFVASLISIWIPINNILLSLWARKYILLTSSTMWRDNCRLNVHLICRI